MKIHFLNSSVDVEEIKQIVLYKNLIFVNAQESRAEGYGYKIILQNGKVVVEAFRPATDDNSTKSTEDCIKSLEAMDKYKSLFKYETDPIVFFYESISKNP
jgi:hypothetical protein